MPGFVLSAGDPAVNRTGYLPSDRLKDKGYPVACATWEPSSDCAGRLGGLSQVMGRKWPSLRSESRQVLGSESRGQLPQHLGSHSLAVDWESGGSS